MQATIEVISDVVCPWCYIGKRRLERALQALGADEPMPSVTWRPFQLNPHLPAEGIDRKTYIEEKFGGPENAKRIYERVSAVGEQVEIPFAFDRIVRQPNTVNAHRLIAYAQRAGRQDAVVEALFQGYFLEGALIGEPAVLASLAARAGLDPAAVQAYLAGDEDVQAVEREERWARSVGVNGVPFFVFNRKYAVSGAQEPEALIAAYRESLAAASALPAD